MEITNAIDMAPIATMESKYISKTLIPSMYRTEREKVAAELRYVKYVATTSDLWSSRTMDPYISLTVHYIDDKWKLAYFPSDHMGEMVGQGLRMMLSAWDIREEAITSDNGANIVKAAEHNKWTRVQCFGHRLHLAIGKCAHLNGDIFRW